MMMMMMLMMMMMMMMLVVMMMMVVMMVDESQFVRLWVFRHCWQRSGAEEALAGPCSNRSGGSQLHLLFLLT